jgi:hypothetical protein
MASRKRAVREQVRLSEIAPVVRYDCAVGLRRLLECSTGLTSGNDRRMFRPIADPSAATKGEESDDD